MRRSSVRCGALDVFHPWKASRGSRISNLLPATRMSLLRLADLEEGLIGSGRRRRATARQPHAGRPSLALPPSRSRANAPCPGAASRRRMSPQGERRAGSLGWSASPRRRVASKFSPSSACISRTNRSTIDCVSLARTRGDRTLPPVRRRRPRTMPATACEQRLGGNAAPRGQQRAK